MALLKIQNSQIPCEENTHLLLQSLAKVHLIEEEFTLIEYNDFLRLMFLDAEFISGTYQQYKIVEAICGCLGHTNGLFNRNNH